MVISGISEFLLERIGDDKEMRGHAREIADACAELTLPLLLVSSPGIQPETDARPQDRGTPNSVVSENAKMLTRLIGEEHRSGRRVRRDRTAGAVKANPGQIEAK